MIQTHRLKHVFVQAAGWSCHKPPLLGHYQVAALHSNAPKQWQSHKQAGTSWSCHNPALLEHQVAALPALHSRCTKTEAGPQASWQPMAHCTGQQSPQDNQTEKTLLQCWFHATNLLLETATATLTAASEGC
jgi:hypothetical protein